jgi:hypothetical protein
MARAKKKAEPAEERTELEWRAAEASRLLDAAMGEVKAMLADHPGADPSSRDRDARRRHGALTEALFRMRNASSTIRAEMTQADREETD